MPDPHDLHRFLAAQDPVIDAVRAELRAGRKRTHWMWFVFPQLRGLGQSPTARHFGIAGRPEAQAYAAHPALFPRLLDCTALVAAHPHSTALAILGTPDDMKFRSCLTLFAETAPDPTPFRTTLALFFPQGPDPRTLDRLAQCPA